MSDKLVSIEMVKELFKRIPANMPFEIAECLLNERLNDVPAAPHEMTAREFLNARNRMCNKYGYGNCPDCPAHFVCITAATNDEWSTKGVDIVEKWAREHPERSKE